MPSSSESRERNSYWRRTLRPDILLALGMVLFLTNASSAQSYCAQVRQAVATYGYAAAKRHAIAHYGARAARAGDRCLARKHPRHRHG